MKEQSTEIKKSRKKIGSLEKQVNLDLEAVEKAKLGFAVAMQERDASNAVGIEARGEVTTIQGQLDRALEQVRELEKIARGLVF